MDTVTAVVSVATAAVATRRSARGFPGSASERLRVCYLGGDLSPGSISACMVCGVAGKELRLFYFYILLFGVEVTPDRRVYS